MVLRSAMGVMVVLSLVSGTLRAADVILNEYNAVDNSSFLGGGDSSADEVGGRASDSYFGRIMGNGGDWFELVVIKDHLDMRGWQLETYNGTKLDKTLTLTVDPIWSDLRAGTIITVAQEVPTDVSYDPAVGDWWINVQAKTGGDGKYISAKSFDVSNKDWRLRIRDIAGTTVFGPAGEGISPLSGVGTTEVFQLRADPSAAIEADSLHYDTNSRYSTFGAPNHWGGQDFKSLRPVLAPEPASITVLAPNGGEAFTSGQVVTVRWQSEGIAETVLVEFSIDNGTSWTPVYPPNVSNTGQYKWLVPLVDSAKAMIRVSSSNRLAIAATSKNTFSIVASTTVAALGNSGWPEFSALARLIAAWLN
ncbi:MAG: hypothetical protein M1376_06700 [Planctomycetes bacterium]|nr:hypothetical protein [Planctomycetota bacterium]